MKKWKCTACGYEFSGETQPEKCPACGVGQERIEAADQENNKEDEQESNVSAEPEKAGEEETSERKWKCTICNYVHVGSEPPDECPVCGADKSYFVEVTDEGGAEEEEKETAPDKSEVKEEHAEAPQKEAKKKKPFGILGRLVVGLNLHPIAVHTPNGVLPLAVIFLFLAMYFQYWALEWAAFFNYIAVFLSMPVVFATGYVAWQRKYNGAKTWIFKTKLTCTAVVAVLVSLVVFWRFIDPDIAHSSGIGSWLYLSLGAIAVVAVGIAGHLGGKLVFKNH